MFGLAATLFFRRAIGALAAGFVPAAAVALTWAFAGQKATLSWFESIVLLTMMYGWTFAPFSMLLLPLTWMAFRRNRYRPAVLLGIGLLSGVLWSIDLMTNELPRYSLAAVGALGALSGLSVASCFLGLRVA